MNLKDFPVYTTVPVVDVERARGFYRDVLGLKELPNASDLPGALFQAGNNTRIYLYQRRPTIADHTVMSFHVKDIEHIVAELREKGVSFETFEAGDIKTVGGIARINDEKGAWFKDTEGNIINLYEKVMPAGKEVGI